MKRIPRSREIDRAFRSLKTEVRTAFSELNKAAAKAMAKGDYSIAEALARRARETQAFLSEVEALRARWRGLRAGPIARESKSTTVQWTYYQPILKAISQLGGEATRKELEPAVLSLMVSSLTPADRDVGAGGRERWQTMIQRARRHLISEGWIEDRPGSTWTITEAGQVAATAPELGAPPAQHPAQSEGRPALLPSGKGRRGSA
jgi:hypothetical protein